MIRARYVERTPTSAARARDAARWLPGGDTRTLTWFEPHPVFMERGSGCYLVDVDGNSYLDFLNNYTSLIHGHAHPAIVRAMREQAERGTAYAAPHESQARLARLLCEGVPSLERVRFCNSGTEAVMHAVRVARAFTGRPLVAKAAGGYHGTWDGVEVGVDASAGGERAVPGLAPGTHESTVVIPYNDVEGAREILTAAGDRLAAVILEPVAGVAGMIPADAAFLVGVGELTRELGALFVLDEIITFRLSSGGAQSLYGITPDLTTLGKIVGGGFPVGAFGGREDVMALTDPRSGVLSHSGTFNGNPATMAAGVAALELLSPSEYGRLNALGDRLREELSRLGLRASGLGSLLNVDASPPPGAGSDAEAATEQLFHLALLNEGIFIAPRGLMCASTPMTDREIDDAVAAVGRALEALEAEQLGTVAAPAGAATRR